MGAKLSRNEFLKLSMLLMASTGAQTFLKPSRRTAAAGQKNVLILVYDAWSAKNISLFGYGRETTPNLARLADNAVVYHNHFAGANWTYPGTSSLLAGAYTFHSRTFGPSKHLIEPYASKNFFGLFDDCYRVAYTHNHFADYVLKQFEANMDEHKDRQSLYLRKNYILPKLFGEDYDTASLSYVQAFNRLDDGISYSVFLSTLNDAYFQNFIKQYLHDYPIGLPVTLRDNFFILDEATEWVQDSPGVWPEPFLAYVHLLPPHAPYKPKRGFLWEFHRDGFTVPEKPYHILGEGGASFFYQDRTRYDEFVLQVDSEIGKIYEHLEDTGVLENTILVITSDHGELFERGVLGHRAPIFHQPVIRVPLLIFDPSTPSRQDVYQPTSAIDLLPTLLNATGRSIPGHLEGRVLPPYGDPSALGSRAIFALDARKAVQYAPLEQYSMMMVKWPYKLMVFRGYDELPEGQPVFEMYDLENDPDELVDIYSPQYPLARQLQAELLAKIQEADAPYR